MNRIHRRSFLERLSLGAGAALLGPMVTNLVREAQGATVKRKRLLVVTFSNGFNWETVVPPEFQKSKNGGAIVSSDFTLPPKLAPFEPWRSRLAIVDGLVNQQGGGGHIAGYDVACVPKTGSGEVGRPGGMTFDQYVAGAIGKETSLASLHVGCDTWPSLTPRDKLPKVTTNGIFAKGKDQPVDIQIDPESAYKYAFGSAPTRGGTVGPSVSGNTAAEDKLVLKYATDDIKKVQQNLAGPERMKMDQYLASIEAIERRLTLRSMPAAMGAQCSPSVPAMYNGPEDVFSVQADIATAALVCGVTNVATVSSLGLGYGYAGLLPWVKTPNEFGHDVSLHDIGHGGGNKYNPIDVMIKFWAEQTAKIIQALQATKEGDGTMFDNTLVMFLSDNAEQHHSRGWRLQALLVGDVGGKLKLGGRYLRYPTRNNTMERIPTGVKPEQRALGDLFSALSHAFDAPVDNWGKDGMEKVQGPLTELL